MPSPSITDWMSSAGAVVAAGAAIVAAGAAVLAARYTKQAVHEAAKAAKAAADQVELQRPRPIVFMTFSYSFKQNRNTDEERFREFRLANIGNSPAFDVEVSAIEVPDATNRLTTETFSDLLVSETYACKHRLERNQGVLGTLQPAETFANDLVAFFNKNGEGTGAERINKRNQIQFTLSYRALDIHIRHAKACRDILAETEFLFSLKPVKSVLQDMEDASVLVASFGLLPDLLKAYGASPEILVQHGMAGDLNYCAFDAEGKPCKESAFFLTPGYPQGLEFYRQMVAEKRRVVVVASNGDERALRAALAGKLLNILITDETTATALLARG